MGRKKSLLNCLVHATSPSAYLRAEIMTICQGRRHWSGV